MFERWRAGIRRMEDAERREPAAPRAERSLAHDLVIALLDPQRPRLGPDIDVLVGGALLAELALEGRLHVTDEGTKARVSVVDPAPLGDPELDDALAAVDAGFFGSRISRQMMTMPHTSEVLRRLVGTGALTEETRTRLGVFTVHRHVPTPSARREDLVVRIESAVRGGSLPDDRTALLLGLIDAGRKWRSFVSGRDIDAAHRHTLEALAHLGAEERAVVGAVEALVDRAHRSD